MSIAQKANERVAIHNKCHALMNETEKQQALWCHAVTAPTTNDMVLTLQNVDDAPVVLDEEAQRRVDEVSKQLGQKEKKKSEKIIKD